MFLELLLIAVFTALLYCIDKKLLTQYYAASNSCGITVCNSRNIAFVYYICYAPTSFTTITNSINTTSNSKSTIGSNGTYIALANNIN
jgi:hypothetical protein